VTEQEQPGGREWGRETRVALLFGAGASLLIASVTTLDNNSVGLAGILRLAAASLLGPLLLLFIEPRDFLAHPVDGLVGLGLVLAPVALFIWGYTRRKPPFSTAMLVVAAIYWVLLGSCGTRELHV
jgi:hypothetical protein